MGFLVGVERALAQRDQNILESKKIALAEQDRRDAKNAKIMDFLNQFGVDYKNSNDSKNNSKKKAEVLLRLKNSFGEDSEIYTSLLAGGSLENLEDAEKIVNEARERVEKTGATFTVQDAIDSFAFYKSEVIENENPITVEQLVERFGVDPDAELSGTGMTYEEAFQRVADKLNQDTYVIGMRGKTPLTEFNPQDLLSFNKLYVENASAAIDAEVTRLNEEKRQEEISRGETPSGLPIDNISEYNKAKDAIKDNDFSLFQSLIPNVASDLASSIIVQYPALKNNRVAIKMYNSSLNFSSDDEGMYALKRAVESGLLQENDIIIVDGLSKRINQAVLDELNRLP
jgi:nucleotide-binding universal stress UspA family protein